MLPREIIRRKPSVPNAKRIYFIRHALRAGFTIEEIFNIMKSTARFGSRLRRLWNLTINSEDDGLLWHRVEIHFGAACFEFALP